MDLHLKGKRALVSGGSRGIGYGVAEVLAAEGCDLHLASLNPASLQGARRRLHDTYGVSISTHACDLSQ
ncbi:MAG: SDR family NAD(P)-dependent oxidoreductase, partial [Burkholderiales bacterium]